jgi:hypothetical protein
MNALPLLTLLQYLAPPFNRSPPYQSMWKAVRFDAQFLPWFKHRLVPEMRRLLEDGAVPSNGTDEAQILSALRTIIAWDYNVFATIVMSYQLFKSMLVQVAFWMDMSLPRVLLGDGWLDPTIYVTMPSASLDQIAAHVKLWSFQPARTLSPWASHWEMNDVPVPIKRGCPILLGYLSQYSPVY